MKGFINVPVAVKKYLSQAGKQSHLKTTTNIPPRKGTFVGNCLFMLSEVKKMADSRPLPHNVV
ncbi:hypothetical protein, partial [Salmonella enterica]|uniref:hypothetical protein n=1 Tax=Salmonella enterica TaxID=28901 RepID=UPI001BAF517D